MLKQTIQTTFSLGVIVVYILRDLNGIIDRLLHPARGSYARLPARIV